MKGPRAYRCHIELATGRATLAYAEPHDSTDMGEEHKLASTTTPFVGPGSHDDFQFANVDETGYACGSTGAWSIY